MFERIVTPGASCNECGSQWERWELDGVCYSDGCDNPECENHRSTVFMIDASESARYANNKREAEEILTSALMPVTTRKMYEFFDLTSDQRQMIFDYATIALVDNYTDPLKVAQYNFNKCIVLRFVYRKEYGYEWVRYIPTGMERIYQDGTVKPFYSIDD